MFNVFVLAFETRINTVSPLISRLVNEAVPLADQVYV